MKSFEVFTLFTYSQPHFALQLLTMVVAFLLHGILFLLFCFSFCREVLCLEVLYGRVITGCADGKVRGFLSQ